MLSYILKKRTFYFGSHAASFFFSLLRKKVSYNNTRITMIVSAYYLRIVFFRAVIRVITIHYHMIKIIFTNS